MDHRDMGEIVLRMSRKRKGGIGATSTTSSRAAPSVSAPSGESGARDFPPPHTTRASSPTKKLPVKRARVEPSIVGGTGTQLSADVLAAKIQEAAEELDEQRTLPPLPLGTVFIQYPLFVKESTRIMCRKMGFSYARDKVANDILLEHLERFPRGKRGLVYSIPNISDPRIVGDESTGYRYDPRFHRRR